MAPGEGNRDLKRVFPKLAWAFSEGGKKRGKKMRTVRSEFKRELQHSGGEPRFLKSILHSAGDRIRVRAGEEKTQVRHAERGRN